MNKILLFLLLVGLVMFMVVCVDDVGLIVEKCFKKLGVLVVVEFQYGWNYLL